MCVPGSSVGPHCPAPPNPGHGTEFPWGSAGQLYFLRAHIAVYTGCALLRAQYTRSCRLPVLGRESDWPWLFSFPAQSITHSGLQSSTLPQSHMLEAVGCITVRSSWGSQHAPVTRISLYPTLLPPPLTPASNAFPEPQASSSCSSGATYLGQFLMNHLLQMLSQGMDSRGDPAPPRSLRAPGLHSLQEPCAHALLTATRTIASCPTRCPESNMIGGSTFGKFSDEHKQCQHDSSKLWLPSLVCKNNRVA